MWVGSALTQVHAISVFLLNKGTTVALLQVVYKCEYAINYIVLYKNTIFPWGSSGNTYITYYGSILTITNLHGYIYQKSRDKYAVCPYNSIITQKGNTMSRKKCKNAHFKSQYSVLQ